MISNINWYPGHMKKTADLIRENLKMVDLVIEVIDARIPSTSRNPIIDDLVGSKERVIVLNKSDLADPKKNELWADCFRKQGNHVVEMNCMSGKGVKELYALLKRIQDKRNMERTLKKPLRMMIVGVPNVGKSSLINRMTGKKSAKTGDKPGVTRGKQWLGLENGMQLLDTPGILWPKFEDPNVGLNLAFCGSIKDEIFDIQDLALELVRVLQVEYPQLLMLRYRLDDMVKPGDFTDEGIEVEDERQAALYNMEAIAKKRGFILPGKRIDYERTGKTILDEFRSATIGKITLDKDIQHA